MKIRAPFKVKIYRYGKHKETVLWRLHAFLFDGYSIAGELLRVDRRPVVRNECGKWEVAK